MKQTIQTKPLRIAVTHIVIDGIGIDVRHSEITPETKTDEIVVMSIVGESPIEWFGSPAFVWNVKCKIHLAHKDELKMLEIQKAIKSMREDHIAEQGYGSVAIFFSERVEEWGEGD